MPEQHKDFVMLILHIFYSWFLYDTHRMQWIWLSKFDQINDIRETLEEYETFLNPEIMKTYYGSMQMIHASLFWKRIKWSIHPSRRLQTLLNSLLSLVPVALNMESRISSYFVPMSHQLLSEE